MIPVQEVIQVHSLLVKKFGGSDGLRDQAAPESALARPFQKFGNKDLYPSVILKSAALIESILINHPFIDGNKRTGYYVLRAFLLSNEMDITATMDEKYDFIISIAAGKTELDDIADWLYNHTIHLST